MSSRTANVPPASYQYDAAGNRTRVTYPDSKQVNYTYDAVNRLAT
jgi:YD repeat-containing protein